MFGLKEQTVSDYTPTTEELEGAAKYLMEGTEAFSRWLAEVKAQAWEQGYKSAERNAVFPDRYVLDVNPYRQEEEQ